MRCLVAILEKALCKAEVENVIEVLSARVQIIKMDVPHHEREGIWEAEWSEREYGNLGLLLTSGGKWGMLAQRFDSKTNLKCHILYCDCFNPVKTMRAGLKVVIWVLVGNEDHLVKFFLYL